MPAGMAVWVIEKANGAYRRTAQRPSNCELAGVATAAMPLPTSADSTKPAAPPMTATAMPRADREQCDLAHANGAVADDEAARSELADQRGDGDQAEIDPDPGRIGVQFGDDQRREHRRQHPADRAAGLLQKHRHDGDQHARQMALPV